MTRASVAQNDFPRLFSAAGTAGDAHLPIDDRQSSVGAFDKTGDEIQIETVWIVE
jgi:hypothetical protein